MPSGHGGQSNSTVAKAQMRFSCALFMKFGNLKKLWKDPVWSQVISVLIIAILTLLYNYLSSLINKTNLKGEFLSFWLLKIPLWLIATFLLICFIVVRFILYFTRNRPFNYDSETLALDRATFEKIRTSILPQEYITYIKQVGFAQSSFHHDRLLNLYKILEEDQKADFHFLNPKLEYAKKNLVLEIESFHSITSRYIFGAGDSRLSIPPEWTIEQPQRFKEAVSKISVQENVIAQKHDEFIKFCRATLKI